MCALTPSTEYLWPEKGPLPASPPAKSFWKQYCKKKSKLQLVKYYFHTLKQEYRRWKGLWHQLSPEGSELRHGENNRAEKFCSLLIQAAVGQNPNKIGNRKKVKKKKPLTCICISARDSDRETHWKCVSAGHSWMMLVMAASWWPSTAQSSRLKGGVAVDRVDT